MKFLIWVILGLVVVAWLMRGKKSVKSKSDVRVSGAESMLQCAHCGLHIPVSEAIVTGSGAVFCSEAHRLKENKP